MPKTLDWRINIDTTVQKFVGAVTLANLILALTLTGLSFIFDWSFILNWGAVGQASNSLLKHLLVVAAWFLMVMLVELAFFLLIVGQVGVELNVTSPNNEAGDEATADEEPEPEADVVSLQRPVMVLHADCGHSNPAGAETCSHCHRSLNDDDPPPTPAA